MSGLGTLIAACAPLVAPATAHALVHQESGGHQFAIGVVDARLERQARSMAEALATVRQLEVEGMNYSVGLAQINRSNFARLGLTAQTAFEPCANLQAMQVILGECFERASRKASEQQALRMALSCYYSGNFQTGFRHGYVTSVVNAWRAQTESRQQQERRSRTD
ncbi:lytic transglycosylase domain-containing protein [Aquincola sp. S2]|uniref:Lytic transglycosylase domain-containing protein n=1 Tax=Pseudaquabacterium terrae TaxID=2732868 RepID=A0ABX2ES82_9BURK|nr:lytic transglycosylase domain-containing protein [Aquabacterium terrae]NRF71365.1 lytic transglycosylase domain-containing protein [Aquabacterium terrae]